MIRSGMLVYVLCHMFLWCLCTCMIVYLYDYALVWLSTCMLMHMLVMMLMHMLAQCTDLGQNVNKVTSGLDLRENSRSTSTWLHGPIKQFCGTQNRICGMKTQTCKYVVWKLKCVICVYVCYMLCVYVNVDCWVTKLVQKCHEDWIQSYRMKNW